MGILTMAGKGVRVLTTPTSDLGKILACMHGMSHGTLGFFVISPLSCLLSAIRHSCSFAIVKVLFFLRNHRV